MVPDFAARFRNTEAAAKMLEMFPKEETQATALFVRMPDTVLVAGHAAHCMCIDCRNEWERQAALPPPPPDTQP